MLLAKQVPWLIGGSADLTPSTKTRLTLEGGRRFSGRIVQWSQFSFWDSRTCNGFDPQRIIPV